MLRVKTSLPEEIWIDPKDYPPYDKILVGVRLKVRPLSPAMTLAAQDATSRVYRESGVWPPPGDAADPPEIPDRVKYDSIAAYTIAMAVFAIAEWEGVTDEAGSPLTVTAEHVRAAMAIPHLYGFFDAAYVAPSLAMEAEKNASSPSQTGTGGARTRAKGTAATARRHARTARTQ